MQRVEVWSDTCARRPLWWDGIVDADVVEVVEVKGGWTDTETTTTLL